MFWGGCSESDLVERYSNTVQNTGGPIVCGAEFGCTDAPSASPLDSDCRSVPMMPPWAVEEAGIADFASGHWRGQCPMAHCCDYAPALRYLSGGFFMGPAREVHAMVTWALEKQYWVKGLLSDQRVFNQYFFDRPALVTLDDTASLVLNTLGLWPSTLTSRGACMGQESIHIAHYLLS